MLFPALATLLVGLAHAIAWRSASGVSTWIWLASGYAPIALYSLVRLHREEVLVPLVKPVAGDVARGIAGAAFGVAVLYGVAVLGIKLVPSLVARDLLGIFRVKLSVESEVIRGVGIVAFSAIEEIVWRGAVTHDLETRVGSARAPWVASGLFVVSMVPALFGTTAPAGGAIAAHASPHLSLILAAVIVGVITAFVRGRFGRLSVAIVAHAFFTWLVIELVLPSLWLKLQGS